MNKKQSYALVDAETGKIIKYNGKLQYFRLKQSALPEKKKLQAELRKKIEIKKLNLSDIALGRPVKNEKVSF